MLELQLNTWRANGAHFTSPESLRVLRDEPMPSIHIRDLSIGEERLDGWDGLVRDISGSSAANKERGALVLLAVCFGERKFRHVIE